MCLAIIDADTIIYKAAGAAQHKNKETGEMEYEPVSHALANAKNLMEKILERTQCTDYRALLTESQDFTCFRMSIYPEYKANRKDKERPKYYYEVKKYLIDTWKAEEVHTIEADDAVSMLQWKEYENDFLSTFGKCVEKIVYAGKKKYLPSVLCGIDKDLDQVPGLHYNYNKDIFYYITPLEGLKNLYMQMLTGDDVDNIPRIAYRWGMKKEHKETKKALLNAKNELELYTLVYKEHKKVGYKEDIKERIKWLGDLLYLRKHAKDEYKIPDLPVSKSE